ncbi:MAG TPA: glycosyltransferase family 1 protein [Candidatus Nanoarchaeia archaeon]|nr:glycosyltransferase family 1 protein [Candidatus Nanoarchaeia archaeon]
MKIGIITDAIDDKAAGIGTYVRNIVGRVIQLDKTNDYYLIHHTQFDDQFYTQFKNNKKVHEIIVPIKSKVLGREWRKIVAMPKILENYHLDLVHETAQTGPFFRKSSFKKIVTIHDLVPLVHPETHSAMTVIHHKHGLPVMLKNVDKIIAVSKNTKKDIEKLFSVNPKKIEVIYEAAETKKASTKEVAAFKRKYHLNKYILIVGSLEPRKNVVKQLMAFEDARKMYDIQLVIITKKGWKNKEIYAAINRSKFKNDIYILNNVGYQELLSAYAGSQCLLFASLYEGFGLPVLEAMSQGCPVITSNISSLPEVAGNAAKLVDPNNTKEIAHALKAVLKDNSQMKKKGFAQVKKFSWEKAAKETLAVYKSVMK